MSYVSGPSSKDGLFFKLGSLLFLLLCLASGFIGAPGQTTFFLGKTAFVSGGFILIYLAMGLSALGLFLLLPQGLESSKTVPIIFILAIVSRLFWLGVPASDDVNRYMWEGHLLTLGISPYHHSPLSVELSELSRAFPYFAGINHPNITAAYPPLLLAFFSFLGFIAIHPMTLKIAMTVLDVFALWLLMRCLKDRHITVRWALLYALNPLVLMSFAGEGHADILQTVFFLGGLCLFHRKRYAWMYVFLGLAVQSKLVVILTFPFFITRENLKFLPLFPLTLILPFIPFAAEGWSGLVQGLFTFGTDFAFNGPVQSLLEALGLDRAIAKMVCIALFGASALAAIYLFRAGGPKNPDNTPVSGSLAILGSLILFSPTVHAWYVCWVLPLSLIRFKHSWLMLSLLMGFYYMAQGMEQLGLPWGLPLWGTLVVWIPFAILMMIETLFFLIRFKKPKFFKPVTSISVVIPAINEEKTMTSCIRSLINDPTVLEVIVVDGGSTDKTADAAKKAGAKILFHSHPPEQGGGRGGQIHRGIIETKGDVVVLVHADTRIEPQDLKNLITVLNTNPDVIGGALGTVFDQTSTKMKIIECLNTLRAAFFSVSFGDQIQFFRRAPIVAGNHFPALPLMEDVEFSLQLVKLGRSAYLFGDSRVSSRRWQKKGIKNALTVLNYFFAYLLMRPWKKPDTVSMYRRYYGKQKV